jgi:hypothetical protein
MKKTIYLASKPVENNTHENLNSEKFAAIALSKSGANADDSVDYLFGMVSRAARGLSDHMFSANTELQTVLVEVLACLKSVIHNSENFYEFNTSPTCDFANFKKKSIISANIIQSKLSNEWPRLMYNIIYDKLNTFFKFDERNLKKYLEGRCKSFLSLINAVMEGQVFNIVIAGYINYLKIFGIGIESPDDSKGNYDRKVLTALAPNQITRPLRTFLNICISLKSPSGELICPETLSNMKIHNNNEIVLSPSIEHIKRDIMDLFEYPLIYTTGCITTLESIIMPYLTIPGSNFVSSISTASHPLPVTGKKVLTAMLNSVIPKIEELFSRYKAFDFLVKQNLGLDIENKESAEFTIPIKKLNDSMKNLNSLSFNSIDFPPFIVDCSLIKRICVQAAEDALQEISDTLSHRIEIQCKNLLDLYEPLGMKLKLDPGMIASWWLELDTTIKNSNKEIATFNDKVCCF